MDMTLASNCILVKGAFRVALCDLQRQKIYLVSHHLSKYISSHEDRSNFQLNETELQILSELIQNDCILWIEPEDKDFFPQISLKFDMPSYISNFIIDVSSNSELNFLNIFNEIEHLLCRHIEIRFFNYFDINFLSFLMNHIENSIIESVDFYVPFPFISPFIPTVINSKISNPRLRWFFIYSTPENFEKPNVPTHIQFTTEHLVNSSHCGVVSPFYFANNISHFTEAQLHNTCLNRKIAIDVDGNIKNCPSMPHSYGNIKDTTLQEALEHPDFKKYWYIHKDQIEVCKDCEFRYICTDCRAYLEDPHNLYSKPLKCGYNPYTCEWEEWSTNPLKQQAIEYYGMQELVKKETE